MAMLMRARSAVGAPSMPTRISPVAEPARASCITSRAASVSPCGRKSTMSVRTVMTPNAAASRHPAASRAPSTGRARRIRGRA